MTEEQHYYTTRSLNTCTPSLVAFTALDARRDIDRSIRYHVHVNGSICKVYVNFLLFLLTDIRIVSYQIEKSALLDHGEQATTGRLNHHGTAGSSTDKVRASTVHIDRIVTVRPCVG